MNRERNFEAALWRYRGCHHHKKTFWGIIWDDLFISEVRLKLCLIILFYWKWYRKLNIPERWPLAFPTFWAFDRCSSPNIDGDISISKLTSWICIYINVVIVSWYLCPGSLMMISLLILSYQEKCCYLIDKEIIRAHFEVSLWCHRWRHHHENFFCII